MNKTISTTTKPYAMNMKSSITRTLLLGTTAICLAACGSTQSPASVDRATKIDNVMEQMARTAAQQGYTEQSLAIMENRYKRSPNDEGTALEYARALREMQYLNRASVVAAPFARAENGSINAKNEFAAIQLALGNAVVAEDFSKQVIMMDAENYQAFQHLGIALDAQGMHEEAERAYRKGLEYWEGDPTSIMNNLALNLATQGYVEEAVEILQKAQSIAPGRTEIERNLRIVSALKDTAGASRKREPST